MIRISYQGSSNCGGLLERGYHHLRGVIVAFESRFWRGLNPHSFFFTLFLVSGPGPVPRLDGENIVFGTVLSGIMHLEPNKGNGYMNVGNCVKY